MRKRTALAEDDTHELPHAYSKEDSTSATTSILTEAATMPMMPMNISMGKDYDSTLQQKRESSHRKAIVATLLACVSLVLSWMVLGARKATAAHQTTSICRSYNAAYFKSLVTQIEQEESESHLCISDITDNCGCLNPFVPKRQQRGGSSGMDTDKWMNILRMNTALLRANYSDHDLQPDLLMYGDSITERLLGRFFGTYGPDIQEYTRVMEHVFTKKGGGQIDGLPLGISSDQVRPVQYSFVCWKFAQE